MGWIDKNEWEVTKLWERHFTMKWFKTQYEETSSELWSKLRRKKYK